jgi:hypothetical protein
VFASRSHVKHFYVTMETFATTRREIALSSHFHLWLELLLD